ncbi:MAG: hypothetical protein H6512_10570 [Acidimicrobiia bacterium]|nr:hypothetical protein [Acidimicrobiia bacterium]
MPVPAVAVDAATELFELLEAFASWLATVLAVDASAVDVSLVSTAAAAVVDACSELATAADPAPIVSAIAMAGTASLRRIHDGLCRSFDVLFAL